MQKSACLLRQDWGKHQRDLRLEGVRFFLKKEKFSAMNGFKVLSNNREWAKASLLNCLILKKHFIEKSSRERIFLPCIPHNKRNHNSFHSWFFAKLGFFNALLLKPVSLLEEG